MSRAYRGRHAPSPAERVSELQLRGAGPTSQSASVNGIGELEARLQELSLLWERADPPGEVKSLLETIEWLPSGLHVASEAVRWQLSDPEFRALFLRCARVMEDMVRPMPMSMLAPPTRQEIDAWYSGSQWEHSDLLRLAAKDFRAAAKSVSKISVDPQCHAAIIRTANAIRSYFDISTMKTWPALLVASAVLLFIAPDIPANDIGMLTIIVALAIEQSRRGY